MSFFFKFKSLTVVFFYFLFVLYIYLFINLIINCALKTLREPGQFKYAITIFEVQHCNTTNVFCLFFRLKISSKTNKWPLRPFKAIINLTMFPCFKLISFTLPLVGVGELPRICRVPFSVKITLKTHGEASGLQQRLSYSWVWCTPMTQSPQLSCLLYNVIYMFMSSCNREINALSPDHMYFTSP